MVIKMKPGNDCKWQQQKVNGLVAQAPKLWRLPSRIFQKSRWIVCGETIRDWCYFDAERNFDGGIGYMPPSKRDCSRMMKNLGRKLTTIDQQTVQC
jgi:hypothetical protein